MSKSSKIRTGTVVFMLLATAKVLNFLKKILVGRIFGISWQADAFFAASYIPYYVAVFFEGTIYLGFLPYYSRIMSQKGPEEAKRLVSRALPWILIFTCSLVAAAWLFAPWLTSQIVPGFAANRQALTCSLFRIISLVMIGSTLAAFFQSLNSYYGDYVMAASAGLTDTFVMIVAMLIAYRFWGIHGAAWGCVAGALANIIFQGAFLFGRKRLPFRMEMQFAPLVSILRFLIPMGTIWFLQQIPLVILNRFASGMWQGTISALVIAQGMMAVPTTLVSQTVILSIFPSLARQAGEAMIENVKETFFKTLRASFFILIPLGFLLSGLARPVAALFFTGNGITNEGTLRIANALACFGWATFAFYADLFMTQSLMAVRKTKPAIFLCASRAILTYAFTYFLSGLLDYQGIALSFTFALGVNFFIFFPIFFRMSPLVGEWKKVFSYVLKLMAAASPAFLVGWFLNKWPLTDWMAASRFYTAAVLCLNSVIVLGIYFLILSRFKTEEINMIYERLQRIGKKETPSEAPVADFAECPEK